MSLRRVITRSTRVAAGAVAVACAIPQRAISVARASGDHTGDHTGDDAGSTFATTTLAPQQIPSHDGGTINFVDSGPGLAPVTFVLSHGVSLSARTWVHQLADLPNAGFRTVAFDHRGHGGSALGATEFSVDNLGDDIATLLETLDLHDVVLVGHSMGGIAVQSFVARHESVVAERVAGIVLLSTVASNQRGSQAAQLNLWAERWSRRTADSTWIWSNRVLGGLLASFGFGLDPDPRDLEFVRRMMIECTPHTRVHGPRSLIGFDLSAELERIDVPTLVVGGTADVITPIGLSRQLHRSIRGSRLEVVEGGGHMLMLERTEVLHRLLVDFADATARHRGLGAEHDHEGVR